MAHASHQPLGTRCPSVGKASGPQPPLKSGTVQLYTA